MSPGDLLSAGSSLAEHPPQDDRGPWSLLTRVSIGTPKVEGSAHFEGVGVEVISQRYIGISGSPEKKFTSENMLMQVTF